MFNATLPAAIFFRETFIGVSGDGPSESYRSEFCNLIWLRKIEINIVAKWENDKL